ncbi:hypothetical protein J3D54_005203 [Pseudomonas sp. GGS8]|nr:hypothetical protein [Pseudomonas sp. GGS8]
MDFAIRLEEKSNRWKDVSRPFVALVTRVSDWFITSLWLVFIGIYEVIAAYPYVHQAKHKSMSKTSSEATASADHPSPLRLWITPNCLVNTIFSLVTSIVSKA